VITGGTISGTKISRFKKRLPGNFPLTRPRAQRLPIIPAIKEEDKATIIELRKDERISSSRISALYHFRLYPGIGKLITSLGCKDIKMSNTTGAYKKKYTNTVTTFRDTVPALRVSQPQLLFRKAGVLLAISAILLFQWKYLIDEQQESHNHHQEGYSQGCSKGPIKEDQEHLGNYVRYHHHIVAT
jgi:hypothetical protein